MKIEMRLVRTFEKGDVVGGSMDVEADDRCYYWRDQAGTWWPFPDDSEQSPRDDEDINRCLESGTLVIYPDEVRA